MRNGIGKCHTKCDACTHTIVHTYTYNLVGHSWGMEYVNVMYTKCDACTHTIVHTYSYNLVGHSWEME